MSRDELIVLVRRQAGQIVELRQANEALAGRLARVEHLLSRNSANSSSPPSKDDDPGRTPPPQKPARGGERLRRQRGKQPGAPGTNLAWTQVPDERRDRFPEGRCECGHDLADAVDLGVAESYQQHEIPVVSVKVTQYDQHRVRCGAAGSIPRTGLRAPGPARSGTARTCRPSPST